MEMTLSRSYSTTEVVRIVGCTYRQLDYWCRTGLIPGQQGVRPGSGRQRRWNDDDVLRAKIVFLASRLSNATLSRTVEMLEEHVVLSQVENEVLELTASSTS